MWHVLIYFLLNLIASIVYINFNSARISRFNIRYSQKKQAKTIPSFVYYSGKLLYALLKIILIIVFLPTFLCVVRPIRKAMSNSAISCFKQSRPFSEDSMTDVVRFHIPDHKVKRLLFHCEFWDAYNSGSPCKNAYLCATFCPCFLKRNPFFIFSQADYEKYLISVQDEYDLVDLTEHQF